VALIGIARALQVKNTSVYVSGLPRDITEQELSDTFGKIGALRKVSPPSSPSTRLRTGPQLATVIPRICRNQRCGSTGWRAVS
jgi:RNA recognition motif-containing protein